LVPIVEFGTGPVRLCRWSGLIVSFLNSTTRTLPDPTRHVRVSDQVSDKIWFVSNSTIHGHVDFVYDPTRPAPRTQCVHVEIEQTSLRPDNVHADVCGDASGPWVSSGPCSGIYERHDQTRPATKSDRARLVELVQTQSRSNRLCVGDPCLRQSLDIHVGGKVRNFKFGI